MARLKHITIKGYRSIKEASLHLDALNILIGANGSGKSNFVSFFKLLNEMMAGRLQQHVGIAGGSKSLLHFGPKVTPQMEAELEFAAEETTNRYHFRLTHAAPDTLIFAEESMSRSPETSPALEEDVLVSGKQESYIPTGARLGEPVSRTLQSILNQCRVYHFHDTSATARMRQSGYLHDNRWLLPDAGNLAAMLYTFRQNNPLVYRRIVSTIRKIVPEFDDFELQPSRLNPNEIRLEWRQRQSDYLFGPHQLSDGSLRAMALITLLQQPEADLPDVILLDEPELGLHPQALALVAGLLKAASLHAQVIVATQSETLLNHFEPSDVITVDCQSGQSRFRRLGAEEFADWLEEYTLGELWERNVLGGGPLP